MFVNPMADIAIASVVIVAISKVIHHKFMDMKGMKIQQKEMKEMQNKINELMKKTDQKSQEGAKKLQGDMMSTMNKMMSKNMKVMMISMAVILPVFWWLSGNYNEAVINLPFSFPFLGTQTNWFWWYLICSIGISIAFAIVTKIYEKTRATEMVN